LPVIQDQPWHGLHWFDPFGSVKFQDLRSAPPVPWDDRAVRYLFWDQEPLHYETTTDTLGQFKKMYNGQHHLITSEYHSEFVERACDTYELLPHYYFFHGWAALDWFRGYDRSFLMTPPGSRHITKTFIAPNRIIAGQREHRLLILYHMFKNQLEHNWISCPAVCPAENVPVTQSAKLLSHIYPDIESVFVQANLPRAFPGEQGAPMHSYCLSLFDQAAESLLYVVTETVATGRRQHLTEKTFKPICLQMPFVMVASAGNLEYLRRYGFRTFGHLWDESYDHECNDILRYEKTAKLLKDLDNLSKKEKQQLFDSAKEICEHNYKHFYKGAFENVLWAELTAMIKQF